MTRIALVSILAASLVLGQPQPPPRPAVSGVVINTSTGEGVRKATVLLRSQDEEKGESYLAESDGNGRFAVTDVAPGSYAVSADRQGFFQESDGATGAPPPSIKVEAGQQISGLKTQLIPLGSITGRVLDEDGDPMRGAQMQAMTYSYVAGKKQLRNVEQVAANDKGEFRLFGLRPGAFYLSATVRNFRRFGRMPGVKTVSPYSATYFPGATDIAHATPVEITAGAQLRGFDVRLRREARYSVRGKLPAEVKTQDGRQFQMQILPVGDAGRRFSSNQNRDDENFEFSDLLPGSYVLVCTLENDGKRQFARQPIEVVNADVEGVTINFSPGVEISGFVRVEGTPRRPLDRLQVNLRPEITPFNGATAEVKTDGSFEIKDAAPNVYQVELRNHPGAYVKSIKLGDEEAADARIDLSKGTGPLIVVLATDVGEVEGSVKKTNGDPAPRVRVTLIPYGGHLGRIDLSRSGFSDQEGKFHLREAAPGEYKIFAWEDVPIGAPQDPEFRKPFEKLAADVKMEPSGHQTVELTTIPAIHSH